MVWNSDTMSLNGAVKKYNEELCAEHSASVLPTKSPDTKTEQCCMTNTPPTNSVCCSECKKARFENCSRKQNDCPKNSCQDEPPNECRSNKRSCDTKTCSNLRTQSNPVSEMFGGLLNDKDSLLLAAVILLLLNENADKKLILALAYVLLF